MFESFKNSELFRHQLTTRIEKSIDKQANQSRKDVEFLSGTFFSACASAVFTSILSNIRVSSNALQFLLAVLIFLITYVIVYLLYVKVYRYLTGVLYNEKRHGTELSAKEIKELIDNFDHISCDNTLICKEFIKKYEYECDSHLREYYFYEIFYYATASQNIISSIFEYENKCISAVPDTQKIGAYRIKNQLSILNDIYIFLNREAHSCGVNCILANIGAEMEKYMDARNELESKCSVYIS